MIATALTVLAAATGAQDPDAVAARAREAGLARHARAIAAAARPAARLDRVLAPMPTALGTSRLGGAPDLPPATPWPTCRGEPMAFLAQVELGDVPEDVRGGLPATGLLSFFMHIEEEEPGIGAEEGFWLWGGNCGEAMLTPTGTALARRSAPRRNPRMVLKPARALVRRELTIPDADENFQPSPPLHRVRLGRKEQDRYFRFRQRLQPATEGQDGVHRLGGFADAIQLDPRDACGGPRDDWRLLLQFDYDLMLGFEVADAGGGWIYARASDLAQGRIGKVCSTFDSA